MHAKLILSAIALLMASEMFADQLTPEEALARMNTTKSQSKGFATDKSSLQLTYTSTFKGNNTYYVFNKGNEEGYLILSADDCMPAVLGVVEGNSFDYDKLPDNMKWWLSQYDVTISNYSAKGRKYVSSATAKKDIEPLLGDIKWDQLAPYNLLCPTVEGKETPTGCVATAMAQVMGMWQWPKRGYGKSEYQWFTTTGFDEDGNYLDELVTISRDFSKSRYEWGKIHSEYSFSGYEPEDEQLAIAQLMYDCGVATNMHYSFNGSATELPYAVNALVRNFGYDKDIRLEHRKFYDDDVWENMVYDNLSKGMPLVCSGRKFFEAHSYVCDGYMADGNLFHFNWGWGGYNDGYFLLSANDESLYEVCTYKGGQQAIFNMKPSNTPYVEGSEGEFPLLVYKSCDFYASDKKLNESKTTDVITRDIDAQVYGANFDVIYPGYVAHEYSIGYKFKNESNEYIIPFTYLYTYEHETQPFTNVSYDYGFNYEEILKNGKYTVSFVYKDITAGNTEWKNAIYQPGVTKTVVEVAGTEPCCCVVGEPEVLYNGKPVTDDELHRVPNVNEITVKFKLKVLAPQKDNKITLTLGKYKDPHESKSLKLTNTAVGAVKTFEEKFSVKDFEEKSTIYLDFLQENKNECINLPYSRTKRIQLYIIDDNPTGIENIPQAEEKAASETIYDIYGRKVSTMNRGGLYIINGKKFLVK